MPRFHDFKYSELLLTKGVRRDETLNLSSGDALRKIADDFFNNIGRIDSFCLFPIVVAAEAFQKQLWRSQAILKVTGKLSLRKKTIDEKTAKLIGREMRKLELAQRKRFMAGKDDRHKRRMTVGLGHINEMLDGDLGTNQSMEALLFSVVVESYMSFESLAGDLLYKALDSGPSEWRLNVQGKSHKFERGSNCGVALI